MTYAEYKKALYDLGDAKAWEEVHAIDLERAEHEWNAHCDLLLDYKRQLKSTRRAITKMKRKIRLYEAKMQIERLGKRLPKMPKIKVVVSR